MKKLLFGLNFSLFFVFSMAQTKPIFSYSDFIYGKDLNKLDKRFKKSKDYPNSKYIVFEIFNPTSDTLYFSEYSQNFSIAHEELFFDDSNSPSTSVGCCFGCKPVSILPNQKKFFVTSLLERKNSQLIKCKFTIEYFVNKYAIFQNTRSEDIEIDILKLNYRYATSVPTTNASSN